MNIYQKLNEARSRFHARELKKSGHNKFAGYHYFELSDFVLPALDIFRELGLTSIVSFDSLASMTIIDCDKPDDRIIITSPLGSASLKGCHEIQNIGACETYCRRYLWMAALEIVEHDAIDSSEPTKGAPKHSVTQGAIVKANRVQVIEEAAMDIIALHSDSDIVGAFEVCQQFTDAEEKTALWGKLPSSVRSAIKRHGESIKESA